MDLRAENIGVIVMAEIPRVTQVGQRKSGKPVVFCPHCKRKVCVTSHDKLDQHSNGPGPGGWMKPCPMSGKEVHFHPLTVVSEKLSDEKLFTTESMHWCPCCGTQPELRSEGIVCPKCCLTLPFRHISTARQLVARWNTRVDGTPSVPNCSVTRVKK